MRVSNIFNAKIKEFEGNELKAYRCPAGVWTIGVGHTKGVHKGQVITQAQSDALLRGDILPVEEYLNSFKKEWTQGEFDALADFCFNFGIGALRNSTLLKTILSGGTKEEIISQFMRWVKIKKGNAYIVSNGLTARRKWEANRYFQ